MIKVYYIPPGISIKTHTFAVLTKLKRYVFIQHHEKTYPLYAFFSLLCCPAVESAFADSEEETETLRMFYKEEDIALVSATRFPKLKSQTAENITIITAKEIEEMNAHTLADVMLNVTGVQIDNYNGLGGLPSVNIQGSYANYVIVLIDGVVMNYFSSGQFDMSALPLQNIERIEIIKGPASSVWGSALGGVINVITKAPSLRKLSGALSASLGERNTGDYRTEASGRSDNFSYYIYGGHLMTGNVKTGIKDYHESHKLDIWKREECLDCEYLPMCYGGCRYLKLLRDGHVDGVDCKKPQPDAPLETLVRQDLKYSLRI